MRTKLYRGYSIHYVTGTIEVEPIFKYDIYEEGKWFGSTNTLTKAKQLINEFGRKDLVIV